ERRSRSRSFRIDSVNRAAPLATAREDRVPSRAAAPSTFRAVLLALLTLAVPPACADPSATVLMLSGSSVGAEEELLRRQIGRFEAANAGVRVEIRGTPDDATQRHQ